MCLHYVVDGQLDADAWGVVSDSKIKIKSISRIYVVFEVYEIQGSKSFKSISRIYLVFDLLSTVCRLQPTATGATRGLKQVPGGCAWIARVALLRLMD